MVCAGRQDDDRSIFAQRAAHIFSKFSFAVAETGAAPIAAFTAAFVYAGVFAGPLACVGHAVET